MLYFMNQIAFKFWLKKNFINNIYKIQIFNYKTLNEMRGLCGFKKYRDQKKNLEINLFLGHLHSLEYFFFYSLEYFKNKLWWGEFLEDGRSRVGSTRNLSIHLGNN